MSTLLYRFFFFFFNDTATTEIYTLSLHDALPISGLTKRCSPPRTAASASGPTGPGRKRPSNRRGEIDRKSTRLNSSHLVISYAVFCLKKKKKKKYRNIVRRELATQASTTSQFALT